MSLESLAKKYSASINVIRSETRTDDPENNLVAILEIDIPTQMVYDFKIKNGIRRWPSPNTVWKGTRLKTFLKKHYYGPIQYCNCDLSTMLGHLRESVSANYDQKHCNFNRLRLQITANLGEYYD